MFHNSFIEALRSSLDRLLSTHQLVKVLIMLLPPSAKPRRCRNSAKGLILVVWPA
jgi:hypothetical protein